MQFKVLYGQNVLIIHKGVTKKLLTYNSQEACADFFLSNAIEECISRDLLDGCYYSIVFELSLTKKGKVKSIKYLNIMDPLVINEINRAVKKLTFVPLDINNNPHKCKIRLRIIIDFVT